MSRDPPPLMFRGGEAGRTWRPVHNLYTWTRRVVVRNELNPHLEADDSDDEVEMVYDGSGGLGPIAEDSKWY